MKNLLLTLTLTLAISTITFGQFANSGYLKSGSANTVNAGAFMQFVPDAANSYSRAVFSHNARWGSDDVWHMGVVGANDAQAILMPNKDGFMFITHPNTGNFAKTMTHANFIAGTKMIIKNNGRVGIGTTVPDSKLTVKGKIHAEEVKVDLNVPGPDYVFDKDYTLTSLAAIEKYILENKHLPGIPSAMEMETNGINLSEMNMKLLEKVEELTLHLISQHKEINALKTELNTLKTKNGK